jgi:hypothetical protein
MNWLPSLRAIIIFAILLAFFAAAYWAGSGHGKVRTSSGTIQLSTPLKT